MHMALPGWSSPSLVREIHDFFERGALLFFAALVVFDVLAHFMTKLERVFEKIGLICFATAVIAEICAYPYSRRNDELSADALASSQREIATIEQANLQLRTDLEKETGKVAILQKDALNAKAAQQKVETDLAKQQEETANAERSLVQLQRRIEPRRISAEQRPRVMGILTRGPKGKVSIDCLLGDGEGQTFANDVYEVLKASGWESDGVNQLVYSGGNPVGFGIVVRSALSAPPYAAVLQRAFFSIGIPMGGIENPQLTEGMVQILIGSKPN
jgi:hypothetical protein